MTMTPFVELLSNGVQAEISDDEIKWLREQAMASQNDGLRTLCDIALGGGGLAPIVRQKLATVQIEIKSGLRDTSGPSVDKAVHDLLDALDADVLREDYPSALVDAELKAAGEDPKEIGKRGRASIEALLEERKATPSEDVERKSALTRALQEARACCPHCVAGEPSVWDDALFHYAHPEGDGLKMCLAPWAARKIEAHRS